MNMRPGNRGHSPSMPSKDTRTPPPKETRPALKCDYCGSKLVRDMIKCAQCGAIAP